MKGEYSFDSILSGRAKKLKKTADERPYFENTNDVLGLYKNPSLQSKETEDEEEEEKKTGGAKGFALLKRIYGSGDPCWKGYEQFGMKEKKGRQVPNCIPVANNKLKANGGGAAVSVQTPAPRFLTDKEKERALKHFVRAVKGSSKEKSKGKGKRVYTEEQKNEMMGLIEDFKLKPTTIMGNFIKSKFSQYVNEEMKRRIEEMKREKNLMAREDVNVGDFDLSDFELSSEDEEDEEDEEIRKPATTGAGVRRKKQGCIPIANNKLKAKGGCGDIPCKTSCKKKVKDTYNKVVENWASNYPNEMTKDIKRVNELHLTPAMKVGTSDNLYKVSNPREVQKKAFDIYGKDAIIYKSNKPNKKYQILDKLTGKFVHFGDAKMEDFEKHLDPVRQRNYLNRSLNIKGKWRENPYSPNTLAIMLLW
jgi:hypothetical protein